MAANASGPWILILGDVSVRVDMGHIKAFRKAGGQELYGCKMTEGKDMTISTAAILVIGDEVLSGRTKDKNIGFIADYLTALGIDLKEARIVSDVEADIVAAVNALRSRYTYVFSTGGIGPTHDDITADAMAAAFGVGISHHPEASKMLMDFFSKMVREANEARMRMARIPHGASLIENSVSVAPGFKLENVFVMAGVPKVMQAMLETIAPTLTTGPKVESRTIEFHGGEGEVAKGLSDIQQRFASVSIGSYPFESGQGFGTNLVLRSRDLLALDKAADAVEQHASELVTQGRARSSKRL
jgi:molybdenum cofactor synthesis domain-containing protein